MSDLAKTIEKLRTRIVGYRDSRRPNEENTKAALIEPLLAALGWNLEDTDEVHREWKFESRDKPVDYAIRPTGPPRLLIEAKALGENLDDHRWASQVMAYATVAGVEWAVLTNGDEYRLYNALAPVSVEEKLFRLVRLSDPTTRPAKTLALLSAELLKEDRLLVLWNSFFVDRKVHVALSRLFGQTPDPAVIRLVRQRTQKLSLKDIHASLARLSARFEFNDNDKSPGADSSSSTGSKPSLSPRTDVTPANLVATRLITPPLALVRKYKGKALTARIESDGTVTFAGKSYSSLSTAAGVARASAGTKSYGRKLPQTNGWTFWQFRDADDELLEIDVLRNRCIELEKLRRAREASNAVPNASAAE